jgi:hypothetical protein
MPGVVKADAIGEKRPGINRLGIGRTVAIRPDRVEMVNKQDPKSPTGFKTVRRVHADVIVLDGNPILFGGNLNSGAPDNMAQPVPCIIQQLWIDDAVVGNQIQGYAGRGVYVVGRIKQLPPRDATSRPSWAIEDVTEADNALFMQWWNATNGGMNFINPQPFPVQVAAPVAPVAAPVAPVQAYVPPAIPAQRAPEPAPAAPPAAPAFDMAGFLASRAPAPAPVPADVAPEGSGITPDIWGTLSEADKTAVYAAMGLQRNGQQIAAPPGF